MIDKALKFISAEINDYLKIKDTPAVDRVKLDNIPRLQDQGVNPDSLNRIILSLVNIEEDRISKNPENVYRSDDNKIIYKNAPVLLNLYCLFAYNPEENDATTNHYEEALKYISYVIQFFQHRNVFTQSNSPALDPGIEKLLMELNTLGFEQLNHLWAVLGGRYLPSVLYKMRLVIIDEDLPTGIGELIKNVNVVEN
ncbi:MAG: DUF4255 domain-containing protein [Panacibacter sp.]